MAKRSRPRRGRDQPRHRFRSRPTDPRKQAAGIVKRLQGGRVRSVGTARSCQERLVVSEEMGHLRPGITLLYCS